MEESRLQNDGMNRGDYTKMECIEEGVVQNNIMLWENNIVRMDWEGEVHTNQLVCVILRTDITISTTSNIL